MERVQGLPVLLVGAPTYELVMATVSPFYSPIFILSHCGFGFKVHNWRENIQVQGCFTVLLLAKMIKYIINNYDSITLQFY